MKAQRGSRGSSTLSLTSALDGSGWLAPRPGSSTPGKDIRYLLYRRLGGPQGRSGRVRKISLPHQDSIPGPSSPQRVAIPTWCTNTSCPPSSGVMKPQPFATLNHLQRPLRFPSLVSGTATVGPWAPKNTHNFKQKPLHSAKLVAVIMDLREAGRGAWTGSIWLRIRTGGGLLWMRKWTFGFHNIRGISWVAEDLLVSEKGLCSMELVGWLVGWLVGSLETTIRYRVAVEQVALQSITVDDTKSQQHSICTTQHAQKSFKYRPTHFKNYYFSAYTSGR